MTKAREILENVKNGKMPIDEAEAYFSQAPYEELGYAKLDMHREIRSGFQEVVFCSGKADEHLVSIYTKLLDKNGSVFGTRASQKQYELIKNVISDVEYDPISKILKVERSPKEKIGNIAVCCAGTADIPVAEEASQTAEYFGSNVKRFYDVGVSGLHRLLSKIELFSLT